MKAIRLYQQLLTFHQSRQNDVALADADLQPPGVRLQQSFGEEKNARYKVALAGFAQHWRDNPISARAMAAHAQVLISEQEPLEAHKIAQDGWNRFPESVGGKVCYNLIQQIEAQRPECVDRAGVEQSVADHPRGLPEPDQSVPARRPLRLGPADCQRGLLSGRRSERRAASGAAGRRSRAQWTHDLEPTDDYQGASAELAVPDDLPPGFYFLLASADEQFSDKDNRVLGQEFWVSPLSLVTRTGRTTDDVEGFVLDADTGEPISGAVVRSWVRQRVVRQNKWAEQPRTRTDKNGQFRIDGTANQSYAVKVEHNGQALSSHSMIRSYRAMTPSDPFERTIFFTDRAIYRPGQTIRFKGIVVRVDQQRDSYKTLSDRSITVVFDDANGQEIAKQTLRTNSYGSFSGSFTAPRDRLTGQMTIRDASERYSRTSLRVEEYKRPKFKVELEAPTEPPRLGDEVEVPGTAKAYTGAAIGGAQVKYRVVREVRYPEWWYWRCWWNPPQAGSQEIAHGATITENDGTFTVPFTARPDPSVLEKDEPTFRFTIYADVTDTTGETRSAQRVVNIAYTALQASLATDEWLHGR